MIWDSQHEEYRQEPPEGGSTAFSAPDPQVTGDWASELPIGLRSDLRALVTGWSAHGGAYRSCAIELENIIREWFGT